MMGVAHVRRRPARCPPIVGARVGIGGLNSDVEGGFAFGLSDTTASDGTYSIGSVPDHDAYGSLVFAGTGYEPAAANDVIVSGDTTVDRALVRDWASLSGGTVLKSASPPDHTDFCGVGANGAFDLKLGSGWPSDAVGSSVGSKYTGPRKAIVRLPTRVDITAVAVASGGACGDDFTAGVKHFRVFTRTGSSAPWTLAVDAKAKSDSLLHAFSLRAGAENVRWIKFVMLSNHGARSSWMCWRYRCAEAYTRNQARSRWRAGLRGRPSNRWAAGSHSRWRSTTRDSRVPPVRVVVVDPVAAVEHQQSHRLNTGQVRVCAG